MSLFTLWLHFLPHSDDVVPTRERIGAVGNVGQRMHEEDQQSWLLQEVPNYAEKDEEEKR